MHLKSLSLQNFRNYKESTFNFKDKTFIVGPNTSGKTNLAESINLLSSGKSFKAEKDFQMIAFEEDLGKIKATLENENNEETELEIIFKKNEPEEGREIIKKFFVNSVSKRRIDFAGLLLVVLFKPDDLDLIIGSPFLKREFLNSVLEQVDRSYRVALNTYTKALRQRNALLELAKEKGIRNERQFEYWDQIIIKEGEIITQKREDFIRFINDTQKDILDFSIFYDKSTISKERLLQYKDAEVGACATLVGPHRDDFQVLMFDSNNNATHDIKYFGSRGQQRLTVLQLKLLEIPFMKEKLGENPILFLDDIFSELDENHINLVLEKLSGQQIIITTTHKEFIGKKDLKDASVIELN